MALQLIEAYANDSGYDLPAESELFTDQERESFRTIRAILPVTFFRAHLDDINRLIIVGEKSDDNPEWRKNVDAFRHRVFDKLKLNTEVRYVAEDVKGDETFNSLIGAIIGLTNQEARS